MANTSGLKPQTNAVSVSSELRLERTDMRISGNEPGSPFLTGNQPRTGTAIREFRFSFTPTCIARSTPIANRPGARDVMWHVSSRVVSARSGRGGRAESGVAPINKWPWAVGWGKRRGSKNH